MTVSRRLFMAASVGTAVAASSASLAAAASRTPEAGRAVSAGPQPPYRIAISATDTPDEVVAKAARVRPTRRQVAWQRLERTAFLHFGVNTFTGLEWGTGDEDPDVFQPAGLDTDQWARALRDGGFELAILTVKHHDGFVLYPSRHTKHSVASSSWRGGKGDVLRDFTASLRKYGLKVGVYVSPADENQYLHGVYANGSARSPRTVPTPVPGDDRPAADTFTLDATDYGAYMLNQLHEVLTEYGPVDEVWFDGAQGRIPPEKVERYDWDSWYALIRALAPDAVIAVRGPDVRWVGNEGGLAREDEWSVVPVKDSGNGSVDYALPYDAPDQGSRAALAEARAVAQYVQWWPAECDVSIRPGWFFHEDERPKSVEQLTDIWFRSVGRNAVLLLNIPPDKRGLLPDADVARLREFRQRIDAELPADLAAAPGARVVRRGGVVTVDLGREREADRVRLAEDVPRAGQQIESFVVEARSGDGTWTKVAGAGTVGASRVLVLAAPVRARHWRVRVTGARGRVRFGEVGLYRSEAG
ncbi:alpha-L-fucosidase [Streptomyces lasiicapitis]|uniref:alpha-L-fucosidase n=1 Tax=Streptomyces lasiicapitis TaxID=1923961 RepID=A0ABQ2MU80_9ACTN|nr:alpha-L-fucosidase [Streptomyces lasiicapitis]GGO58687.1 hypothetical protein GCM10012286_78490 [Streptomyces lasiicapitis]